MTTAFDPAQIAKDFESHAQLSPEERHDIQVRARGIDLKDALTVTGYGAKEQRDLGDVSDILLSRVSGSALEDAVDAIHALQQQIAGLDVVSLRMPKGFFSSLFSPGKRQYTALQRDCSEMIYLVDRLANQIDMARLALQKEIGLLDTLYESNRACYHALERKILAGELALAHAKQEKTAKDASGIASFVDLFSDRIRRLRQSKTISLQLALQIRLTQHNQKLVADKLKQMTEFALPLWQSQLALALNMNRQREAWGAFRVAARQTAQTMDHARQTLNEGRRDPVQAGKNASFELERLKEAHSKLKQLLEEALANAQQAKISWRG
ncbi:MAG: toxic anion resistance protein [Candidatus Excrementavichristensenella sp.]|jgi:uncharacterized protein YaaN involved in tellurite resistance